MLWLMDTYNHNEGLRNNMTDVNNLFKQAGIIRNAQVCLKYFQSHNSSNSKIILAQQNIIHTTFKSFASKQMFYENHIEQTANNIKKLCVSIPTKNVLHIVEKRKRKIVRQFKTNMEPTLLHPCRKKIKTIIYIDNFLSEYSGKHKLSHAVKWEELQQQIGDWHDLMLFDEQLHNQSGANKTGFHMQSLLQKKLDGIQQLITEVL